MTSGRPASATGRLARLGFADPARALQLLDEPALRGLLDPLEDHFEDGLVAALAGAADPDMALLALLRLVEALPAARTAGGQRASGGTDPDAPRLHAVLRGTGEQQQETSRRLIAVLGASAAFGDHLARHPEHWIALCERAGTGAEAMRAELLAAVAADPAADEPESPMETSAGYDALRVAYRRRLLAVAGRDLGVPNAVAHLPEVASSLADLAGAALEAALAIARGEQRQQNPDGAPCRLAVIGMGKCGGEELNYVSDVDVIYVVEPGSGADGRPVSEAAALESGTRLAAGLARACSATTPEGTLWPVDAGLRPEGKNGPLVRTVASHVAYYQRWAKTWEFQALLKARPVAGDPALGRAYVEAVLPLVWRASEREGFVEDVQAMRRRVLQHVPAQVADRQLKLGSGGLRDVEFSVQLLQLVHGRTDERLRSPTTLTALEALATHGYVGRDDAAQLDRAYRYLRCLEHRLQLYRLRRTHVLPTSADELRRLGRSMGGRRDPVAELERSWRRHQREVRRLHEKLFYRPLLAAVAQLSTREARLTPEAARARLLALGYRDPSGAMRHLEALTTGVSRRAEIQRTLLPVMLGWFADGADPDAGLLAFRRVSEALGTTPWYLKMLRDTGAAAERLARVLAASRLVADLLLRGPQAVAVLADDDELRPRTPGQLSERARLLAQRQDKANEGVVALLGMRRRETLRTAVAQLVGLIDLRAVGEALSATTTAVLQEALALAERSVADRLGHPPPTRLLVVGMGRFAGHELGYGSDVDVMFVHDPLPGADERTAQQAAAAVVSDLRRMLSSAGPEPPLEVDANLRPEGRNGPLVRSLESYRAYYRRWSAPWEAQALLRSAPAAGDTQLGESFTAMVDPLRYPRGGVCEQDVREIRRIKARIEAERLPRGVDPARHLKLGRGGLADVEWTVQLLQLQHSHDVSTLRTTSTLGALDAAALAGLLAPADRDVLTEAWCLASTLRNAAMLWRGRPSDVLPADRRDLDGIARILEYPPGSTSQLQEDYRRAARRARVVMERVFYGG